MDTADTKTVSVILRRHTGPVVAFCAIAVLVLGLAVAVAAWTLMGSYRDLERSAALQRAEQIQRALDADLRQLAISNRDYARWDAAEEFIVGRDPAFIPGNFSAMRLLGMHVDIVWMTDAGGRDIHTAYVDRATGAMASPAPAELLEPLRRFKAIDDTLRSRAPVERLVRTRRGLAGVSATEIARSDGSRPTGAVLLFARLIDDAVLARIAETTRMPVSLLEPTSPATALPSSLGPGLRGGAPYQVRARDGALIESYALLSDVDGAPAALLMTTANRDIRAIGLRTTLYVLIGFVVLFLVFGVVCLALVARLVTLHKRGVVQRRDAEEQQRRNRKNLAQQAQRDFLTGLPNRIYAQQRIPRLLSKMSDSEGLLAVIHIDLDHFKNLNESRGHASGDQLINIIAKRLRAAVARSDLVARMGGDEFVVVASSLPSENEVDRLARRLRAAIAASLMIEDTSISVTASLGIALYPRDGVDAETLLKRADIALYQAKEAGRRCHRFFSADMDERVSQHAVLEQELRQSVGTSQIYLDYQPIVDLRNGRLVSLEALMRWRHPERGLIPPAQFIPVAEKSGLILELGQHALQQVLRQQRAWLDAKIPVVPIAVNVSAIQIERTDFGKLVKRLTASVGVDPKWVRFEITESAVMKEPDKLIGALQELRSLGSQVLLDDFGTGYSSLSYLNRLPIDIVKIDRAFVRELTEGDRASPVIPLVVDMARQLGLKTVAEGVETAAQAAGLFELGCDFGQGYFYSKPVAAHHCKSLLEHLGGERRLSETVLLRAVSS